MSCGTVSGRLSSLTALAAAMAVVAPSRKSERRIIGISRGESDNEGAKFTGGTQPQSRKNARQQRTSRQWGEACTRKQRREAGDGPEQQSASQSVGSRRSVHASGRTSVFLLSDGNAEFGPGNWPGCNGGMGSPAAYLIRSSDVLCSCIAAARNSSAFSVLWSRGSPQSTPSSTHSACFLRPPSYNSVAIVGSPACQCQGHVPSRRDMCRPDGTPCAEVAAAAARIGNSLEHRWPSLPSR